MDNTREQYATEDSAVDAVRLSIKTNTGLDERTVASIGPEDSLQLLYGFTPPAFRALYQVLEREIDAFLPELPKIPNDNIRWLASACRDAIAEIKR